MMPPKKSFTHAQTMDTRPLFLHPHGLGSLQPRLSIPDFGLGALEKKSKGKPGIFLTSYGGTMTSIYQSWRQHITRKVRVILSEGKKMQESRPSPRRQSYLVCYQGNPPNVATAAILAVTALPKYWSLCIGVTKKLHLKLSFCSTRINSWAT